MRHTDPFRQFVEALARLQRDAHAIPLAGAAPPATAWQPAALQPGAPIAMLLSPHPDDEIITGGLPLRLLREASFRVVNVAVTLGSNLARREARWQEAQAACSHVGFELVSAASGGLSRVTLERRAVDPVSWARDVTVVAELIARHAPRVVFAPHDDDWNQTHRGTHQLLVDALTALGSELDLHVVETEFWRPISTPNLMVELDTATLADLVTALALHAGEMQRNPLHISLPAWMTDNVRRGAEVVFGQGQGAPPFAFATLYRIRRWRAGGFAPPAPGRAVAMTDDVAESFL
jgi:LmbE family N-acetylglucosaminyl deacetylase